MKARRTLQAPEGFVLPPDFEPLEMARFRLRLREEDRDDGDDGPAKPKTSRPRKVPQPVDRSALHGPLADMPRSRAQAQAEGAPFHFLGLTCTKGHNAPRRTHSRLCAVCQQEDRQKARQAASQAQRRAIKVAAEEAAKEARRQARDAEREAQKKDRASAKAQAAKEARKAAKAAEKAAALAQATDALHGSVGAPPGPSRVQEVKALEGAPWDDDSAPWDMSPATAPLPAQPLPSPLPSSPPPGPCPWDDTHDINPFE